MSQAWGNAHQDGDIKRFPRWLYWFWGSIWASHLPGSRFQKSVNLIFIFNIFHHFKLSHLPANSLISVFIKPWAIQMKSTSVLWQVLFISNKTFSSQEKSKLNDQHKSLWMDLEKDCILRVNFAVNFFKKPYSLGPNIFQKPECYTSAIATYTVITSLNFHDSVAFISRYLSVSHLMRTRSTNYLSASNLTSALYFLLYNILAMSMSKFKKY